MTAIDWLVDQMFKQGYFDGNKPLSITNLDHLQHQAKEMEKQQIIKSRENGISEGYRRTNNFYYDKMVDSDIYYSKTYGSKGSDGNFKQFSLYEHKETIATSDTPTSSQTEISWEGCDGCTEQDEIMYKNGYVKGYNVAISELPNEISDEEIMQRLIQISSLGETYIQGYKDAIIWYREQLKKK